MSLPYPYTNASDYFKDVINFLSNYSWLYKEANTQILTKKLLDHFPSEWYPYLENLSNEELRKLPFGYINDLWPESLRAFIKKLESFKPQTFQISSSSHSYNLPTQFFQGLSVKKKHEILNFAPLIHDLCESLNIKIIIDIGAGLGYLPQLLYKCYGYKVLAVEADETKLETALRRQNQLYKDSINSVKYFHHFIDGNSIAILENALINFDLDETVPVCLIGLHACADLSVTLLRIFCESSRMRAAIVMPCCYHRLRRPEQNDGCPSGDELFVNFPVSCSLRDVYRDEHASEFLTCAFLRLACQNTAASWRCMSPEDHRKHSIGAMRRAALQLVAERDEAHWWLNGCVNKQNARIWGDGQPEEVEELPLHPEKTTVWCGLWAGGIIGPYFFKTEAGQNVIVNRERYRAMITDYLLPEIEARGLDDICFQQDDAAPLSIQYVKAWLYCENDSVNNLFHASDQ